jgi:pullulanase-type alpha-1,6-glucosidase
MVSALHEIGLLVVVDVVYNHTSAYGLNARSVLDKVVPGYYQRYHPVTGAIETSTCCPNTASEHFMMEKLMIDSILLWAEKYKIDSFRFDLMGHHPLGTMRRIQQALTGLTLERNGVDGARIYIYGEGWNFGEVADNRIFDQATQFMTAGTGLGNFNDRLRDGIRGRNFTDVGRRQGFVSGMYLFPNEAEGRPAEEQRADLLYQADQIRVGLAGNLRTYPYVDRSGRAGVGGRDGIGYTLLPTENVNYIDKHDNETLWDNTQTKLPLDMSLAERVRVHMLSNAFINFGQGVPFYQMGSDILRSKSLDRNSYDSGDWFNRVDFTLETHNWGIGLPPRWDNANRWSEIMGLLENPNMKADRESMQLAHQLFMEQLRIRYSTPLFRLRTAEDVHSRVRFHNVGPDQVAGLIVMSVSDGVCAGRSLDPSHDGILVLFNASREALSIELGLPNMVLHPVQVHGLDPVVKQARNDSGLFTVPGLTAAVFGTALHETVQQFPCNID